MEPSNYEIIMMCIWMVALISGIIKVGFYFDRKEKERKEEWY